MSATLSQKEQDIQMMLAAGCHLGTKQLDFQMERYVYKRRDDGEYHPRTWELGWGLSNSLPNSPASKVVGAIAHPTSPFLLHFSR